jgi:hypothetical protein
MAIGHPAFCGFFEVFFSGEGTLLRRAERIQRVGRAMLRKYYDRAFGFLFRHPIKKMGRTSHEAMSGHACLRILTQDERLWRLAVIS